MKLAGAIAERPLHPIGGSRPAEQHVKQAKMSAQYPWGLEPAAAPLLLRSRGQGVACAIATEGQLRLLKDERGDLKWIMCAAGQEMREDCVETVG
jgi:hypothetical protein